MPSPREELEHDLFRYRQRFVLVVGSGISRASCRNASCASWTGLLQNGVDHCRNQRADLPMEWVTAQQAYLKLARPDDLILVATAVTNELRHIHPAEYGRWLAETIGRLVPTDTSLIRALESWHVPLSTTNYDTLLETVLQRKSITWREPALAHQFLLGDTSEPV